MGQWYKATQGSTTRDYVLLEVQRGMDTLAISCGCQMKFQSKLLALPVGKKASCAVHGMACQQTKEDGVMLEPVSFYTPDI